MQVNILPNTEDWADNTTALSGMSGEELQAAVTNRNLAHEDNGPIGDQHAWKPDQ